jgi:hypothetical protein
VTAFVSLLLRVHRFSFFIYNLYPTEMSSRDVTLADKIALLGRIKNRPPDTSYRQLAEITGVPKEQQEKLRNELTLRHKQQGVSPKTEGTL